MKIPQYGLFLLVIGVLSQRVYAVDLKPIIDEISPAIIEARHHIHQHPELGNREFETAQLVAEHMRALGLEVETQVGVTGVVGLLKGRDFSIGTNAQSDSRHH